MMQFVLHVTCSYISHAYVPSFQYLILLMLLGTFLIVLFFFSLYFCLHWSCLWHLNVNPLQPGTLFVLVLLHLLILHLLTFGSMMMMSLRNFRRTSLDEAFIWNSKSFCQTLPAPTFPLSFTVGDGSHCVTSRLPASRADPGVLLQHAWDWSFSTSLLHSRSRYAHSCHTATGCCYGTPQNLKHVRRVSAITPHWKSERSNSVDVRHLRPAARRILLST